MSARPAIPLSLGAMPRRAYRFLRKRAKRVSSYVWLAGLKLRNRMSRSSVLGNAEVTVSLTTYGSRLKTVAYAIESIAAGNIRPKRMLLWLDDLRAFEQRPASVRRLERRGLEVGLTKNYGPHTKYFPSLDTALSENLPIVTADDDILYPRRWLHGLVAAAWKHPEEVSCYRASIVTSVGGRIAPYDSWPRCKDTVASVTRFATGVSGVYYPVTMLRALAAHGQEFLKRSPRADDIWLHWVALQGDIRIRQISPTARAFPYIPGTQEQTLVEENVHQGANDLRIAGLYAPSDIERLTRAALCGGTPEGG
jgi:hypothetical protein